MLRPRLGGSYIVRERGVVFLDIRLLETPVFIDAVLFLLCKEV